MDKRQLWHFSKDKDIEQTADDPASGRPAQPDHFPNVVRPGGGYPEGKGKKTDAFCNKCKDQLIDGSCLRCDWGPQNRSVPVKNFPLDPFRDDKAGIRAASWKFSDNNELIPNSVGYWKSIFDQANVNTGQNCELLGFKIKGDFKRVEELKDSDLIALTSRVGNKRIKNSIAFSCPEHRNEPQSKNLVNLKPDQFICQSCGRSQRTRQIHNPLTVGEIKSIIEDQVQPFLNENYKVVGFKINNQEISIDQLNDDQQITTESYQPNARGLRNYCLINCPKHGNIEVRIEKIKSIKEAGGFNESRPTPCGECNKGYRQRGLGSKEIIQQMITSDPQFQKALKTLTEKAYTNEYAENTAHDVYKKLCAQFPKFKEKVNLPAFLSIFGDLIKDLNFERPVATVGYNPKKPGEVYVFKSGSSIKVGITNNLQKRINEFRNPRREQIPQYYRETHPDLSESATFGIPMDAPNEDLWIKMDAKEPSAQFYKERGRMPYSKDNPPTRPKPKREQGREIPQEYISSLSKESENSEDANSFFRSGEIKNGYIPKAVEAEIARWWESLGISTEPTVQNYTETISLDPSRAKVDRDIATDLTVELHVFLVEKLISNGGSIEDLQAQFTPEDSKRLLSFFDNDPNKLSKAFNLTANNEGGYDLGNELGQAIGVSELLTGQELVQFGTFT